MWEMDVDSRINISLIRVTPRNTPLLRVSRWGELREHRPLAERGSDRQSRETGPLETSIRFRGFPAPWISTEKGAGNEWRTEWELRREPIAI